MLRDYLMLSMFNCELILDIRGQNRMVQKQSVDICFALSECTSTSTVYKFHPPICVRYIAAYFPFKAINSS